MRRTPRRVPHQAPCRAHPALHAAPYAPRTGHHAGHHAAHTLRCTLHPVQHTPGHHVRHTGRYTLCTPHWALCRIHQAPGTERCATHPGHRALSTTHHAMPAEHHALHAVHPTPISCTLTVPGRGEGAPAFPFEGALAWGGSGRVRHLAGTQLGQDRVCHLRRRHGPCPCRQAAIPIPRTPAKAAAPFRRLFGGSRVTASSRS